MFRLLPFLQCIGVTLRIITVPAPSTTITLPVTETSLTTVTQVAETTSVTITDATVSVTTTATTVTNTIATTVEPPAADVTGVGRLYKNGVATDGYVGEYLSSDMSYGYYTTDVNAATKLRLDSSGQLWFGDKVAKIDFASTLNNHLMFVYPNFATSIFSLLICPLVANSFVDCVVGPQTPPVQLVFMQWSGNFIHSTSYTNAVLNDYRDYIVSIKLL
ncbi:uncharacterized protein DFL_002850 [Arthrobotrys flagrans]|uniref:Uncharacterized protein n=1 Tax=Arthrobotrys flagrans TaxID=97331 RepID=A0A437ABN2_ARTFL|nr:hypothetical protein DFL_002850 [Arthrobotrys flagrans]